jgi:hypothetical protein
MYSRRLQETARIAMKPNCGPEDRNKNLVVLFFFLRRSELEVFFEGFYVIKGKVSTAYTSPSLYADMSRSCGSHLATMN